MSYFYDCEVGNANEALRVLTANLAPRFDMVNGKPLPKGQQAGIGIDSYQNHFRAKPEKRLYAMSVLWGIITVRPGDEISDVLTRTSEIYQIHLVRAGKLFDPRYRHGEYYLWTGPGHEPIKFTRIIVEPRIEVRLAA